jgi:hypothetical protein
MTTDQSLAQRLGNRDEQITFCSREAQQNSLHSWDDHNFHVTNFKIVSLSSYIEKLSASSQRARIKCDVRRLRPCLIIKHSLVFESYEF